MGIVYAQEKSSEEKPLSYTIKFVKVTDRMIELECIFENISDHPIVIDKKGAGYQLEYIKHGRDLGRRGVEPSVGRVEIGHYGAENYKGSLLLLPPKDTYRTTKILDFSRPTDDDFIESGYIYTFSETYGSFTDEEIDGIPVWKGHIDSNKLSFKVTKGKVIPLKKAYRDPFQIDD